MSDFPDRHAPPNDNLTFAESLKQEHESYLRLLAEYEFHLRRLAANDDYNPEVRAMLQEAKRLYEKFGFAPPPPPGGNRD